MKLKLLKINIIFKLFAKVKRLVRKTVLVVRLSTIVAIGSSIFNALWLAHFLKLIFFCSYGKQTKKRKRNSVDGIGKIRGVHTYELMYVCHIYFQNM